LRVPIEKYHDSQPITVEIARTASPVANDPQTVDGKRMKIAIPSVPNTQRILGRLSLAKAAVNETNRAIVL
jgi:hypothetical protein